MIHSTIKEQIKDALRNKDTIRLDTLRGLNALALNEILATALPVRFSNNSRVSALAFSESAVVTGSSRVDG